MPGVNDPQIKQILDTAEKTREQVEALESLFEACKVLAKEIEKINADREDGYFSSFVTTQMKFAGIIKVLDDKEHYAVENLKAAFGESKASGITWKKI